MVKAFKVLSLLLLGATLSFAEDLPQVIGPFGGLNDNESPIAIPSNKAQDLLNVEITDQGRSVKKRKGIGLSATLAISTSPTHGIHTFYDASGNIVDLYFNDTRMSASVSNAAPVVVMSTGPNGATYSCVDSQGFAYCANTSRTFFIRTNGNTFGYVQNVNSTGTLIAVTPERLVVSGFSDAPNRIDFSGANNFNSWTPGGEPTSPTQETITAPGSKITHITYVHGRIYWFKETSFGYVQFGTTLADWTIRTVSPTLGTVDNTSIVREEILYFRGNDSHYYAYDGSNIVKLSRDISGAVSDSQSRTSNFITETDATDWGAASYDNLIYVDTETVSGNLQTTFPDTFSAFRDGTSGTRNTWFHYVSNSDTGSASIVNGKLRIQDNGPAILSSAWVRSSNAMPDYRQGTTYYFEISSITTNTSLVNRCYIGLSSKTVNAFGVLGDPYFYTSYWVITIASSESNKASFLQDGIRNNKNNPVDVSSYSITMPFTLQFYISTNTYAYTINGSSTIKSGTHTWDNSPVYLFMGSRSTDGGIVDIDNFSVTPQTFTYTSPLLSIGNSISSWDSFVVSDSQGDATLSYQIGSTNTASVSAITNYQNITSGLIPTISTNPYAAVKAFFSTDEWDDNPALNSYTVNWFEGAASDKSYASYFNDSLWFSITSGTSTINNRIHRFDMVNQDWTIFDLGNNGMLVKNNSLYLGSSTEGKIFKFGDSENDAGNAINAYWKSKDFIVGSPFVQKEFTNLSVSAGSVFNSSMTVTYTVNGSSSSSYQFPIYQSNNSYQNFNKNLPLGTIGNTFNVRFGNNGADQPFEVFAVQFGTRPKPWIPTK